jgi:hypothetical protein
MTIVQAFLFSVLIVAARSWVADLQKAASIATISAALSTAPLVSQAVDFSGSYADPFHQNCQRVIEVKGSSAILSGTDGNPACPPDGSGTAWKLTGKVDGDKIFVDFSPKGGPTNLKGYWDASSPAGIKWPDGNKWTKKN